MGYYDIDYDERRGKGFEDLIDNKIGFGLDYDMIEIGFGYGVIDIGVVFYKKGIIIKIKEKLYY